MPLSTQNLLKIAAWGGIIVCSTGFYLQTVLVDRVRNYDYYKAALKILRTHAGAVHYLGEPIKDRRFKLSDPKNNYSDGYTAKFNIPVSGTKDGGIYYIWAKRENNEWKITKAELSLKSKPDVRLVVVKGVTEKMFEGTAREKFFYHNTLLCLVKSLQNQNTIVDLRNDSYVCGLIASVDGFMNISMSKVVYCDPQGKEYSFENLFIHARNIRYVHIPQSTSILTSIRNELSRTKQSTAPKKPTEKSRKAKKALKLHMETVASI